MNIKISFISLISTALCFVACSENKVANEVLTHREHTTFVSEDKPNSDLRTRTEFDAVQGVHFSELESMSAFVWAGNTKVTVVGDVVRKAGNPSKIDVTFETAQTGEHNYVFLYPKQDKAQFDMMNEKISGLSLDIKQIVGDGQLFDAKQDFLVSEIVAHDASQTTLPKVGFKRMFTFLNLSFDKWNKEWGTKIQSVKLTVPKATLSGEFTLKTVKKENYLDCIATFTKPSDFVEVNYTTPLDVNNKPVVWLVINPLHFTELQFEVITDTKVLSWTYKKNYTFVGNKIYTTTFNSDAKAQVVGVKDRNYNLGEAYHLVYRPINITLLDGTTQTWLDRNLGATEVAHSKGSTKSFGYLYQWSRKGDGHEIVNWISWNKGELVNGLASKDSRVSNRQEAGHNQFIPLSVAPYDWASDAETDKSGLWGGRYSKWPEGNYHAPLEDATMVNNPCPEGYRLPTRDEMLAMASSMVGEQLKIKTTHKISKVNDILAESVLHLPSSGNIEEKTSDGKTSYSGTRGIYWTNLSGGVLGEQYNMAYRLYFDGSQIKIDEWHRGMGYSVRCIRDTPLE